jgi:hypothetical protein
MENISNLPRTIQADCLFLQTSSQIEGRNI